MRILSKAPDGGNFSGVTGYFILELKPFCSIVLLHFAKGTREAFHSHAFNAITMWLKGHVIEHDIDGETKHFSAGMLKYTPRDKFHKVEALESTWAISVRGPWVATWKEMRQGRLIRLTHGRLELPA
jgi:quercetin dioxygenase-like cupin family protein